MNRPWLKKNLWEILFSFHRGKITKKIPMSKVIHPKMYKKDGYSLAYTIDCLYLGLSLSQKYTFLTFPACF